MKKVDNAFVEQLHLKNQNHPSPLTSELAKMTVGDILFVSKEEWAVLGYKSEPSNLVNSAIYQPRSKCFGWRFSTRKAEEGWVLTRTK